MWTKLTDYWKKLLRLLHLSPLSLAEKCRLTFGGAIVLVLMLALVFPYIWMRQLTIKVSLDAGKAKSEILLENHFRIKQAELPPLDNFGEVMDINKPSLIWIQLNQKDKKSLEKLEHSQRRMIKSLLKDESRDDNVILKKKESGYYTNYARIIRATEKCRSCHNPQGSASSFAQNEAIGATVIVRPATDFKKMVILNRTWVLIAGLIGGIGAIVAFYVITQRVILRPIRQLRALANNVGEGNLDIRSSIKTGDEYEKLSEAFNHMLDNLQQSQEKLRQANKQLDAKIAELSERNIELFKANKLKGEFLANISHEFRTPLNAILGFAEILREKSELLSKEKGRKYAENIIAGGKNLLNMITDLLDMAKTEAGKMKLHIEKTSIPTLCREVLASFSALTKKKKIKVKLTIEDDIPEFMTDTGKVQQIIYNFLSNSVKFTPQRGRIEIKAQMADEKTVRISVTDTGCGIAEVDKEKIFEKFRQADGSLTRRSQGSGLGLAISKELAAMLAGDIGIESEEGKGATFWLDIPVTISKQQDDND